MTDMEMLSKQVEDLMKKYSKVHKTLIELQKSKQTPPVSAFNTKDAESQKLLYFPRNDDCRSLATEEWMASKPFKTLWRISMGQHSIRELLN